MVMGFNPNRKCQSFLESLSSVGRRGEEEQRTKAAALNMVRVRREIGKRMLWLLFLCITIALSSNISTTGSCHSAIYRYS